jgi:hypothetical protein
VTGERNDGGHSWINSESHSVSLDTLPLHQPPEMLGAAVRRLRRALRDIRDRMARRDHRWHAVAGAGMALGGGTAMLLVRHPGICEAQIVKVLRRHWPDAQVTDITTVFPIWNLGTEDAVELARAKRGVEPLRIIVMGQGRGAGLDPLMVTAGGGMLEPMPAIF